MSKQSREPRTPKGKPFRPERQRKSRLGLWAFLILLVLVGGYAVVLEASRPHVSGDTLRYDIFVQDIADGKIKDARILDVDGFVVGTYVRPDGSTGEFNAPLLKSEAASNLILQQLSGNNVPTDVDQQNVKRVVALAGFLLPGAMLVVLFGYLILSYRSRSGLFAIRSGARKATSETKTVTFADVAGQASAVEELREIGQFLADPGTYTDLGARVPRGVLLYGPPGCGKTLLAKALAAEVGANFYSISGSDFVEVYVGVGAARVRDLFREARENTPAVVFIDELDSIGRRRGGNTGLRQGSHPEQEQALNQILAEMDGFSPSAGVIVIAATNRSDILDPALLRPGRFDRTIGLEKPDEPARLEILQLHARERKLDPSVDLADLARRTVGLNGADLANIINEGALLAARARRPAIVGADLAEALQRIQQAPDRQRRLAMRDRGFGRKTPTAEERVGFADVAGQDAAVAELREIEAFIAAPERYVKLGGRVPRGVLLMGPPGCGKTLLARALAAEANAAFFSVTGTEFVEVFVGEGAARIRDLFAEARSASPAILFIDEIDSIGRRRGGGAAMSGAIHPERDQALDQLLTEMDGFAPSTGLIVVGATNRAGDLDPALLRPGRFDRVVGLERPDEAGRLAILQLHARKAVLALDVDLRDLARRAVGLSGADLANVVNEAALLAGRRERLAIGRADVDEALQRVLEAPDRQRRLSMRDRSFARHSASGVDRVTFGDLAGIDDAVAELAEFRDFLAEPARFAAVGARVPRGVLLVGPPGCGKTMLARAVAGETNAAFFAAAATEFVEVFVGEGSGRVRDLFAEARSSSPAIVFIDEIDAIGGQRVAGPGGNREWESTLNQILVEMDGFDARAGVIVMAATNRPDVLDPALLRPGRFDRQVTIELPDRAGRRAILELYTRDKRLAPGVDIDALAGITQGFSGADLANLVNEAALLAGRRRLAGLDRALLNEALERSILGVTSRGHLMTEKERRMVAYHEAGHALVIHTLPDAGRVHKVSIVSRGRALGSAWHFDETDRLVHTRGTLLDRMAGLLGGRVAEEMATGEMGAGAADDLRRVTEIAHRMVCDYGMSTALGPVIFPDPQVSARPVRGHSEEVARVIDTEVHRLVVEAHAKATKILTDSTATLHRIAAALLEREILDGAEIERLANGEQLVPLPVAGPAHPGQNGGAVVREPLPS